MPIIQYITNRFKKDCFTLQDIHVIKQKVEVMRNSCATEADWNNALWKYDKLMKDMPYDIEKIGVMYANVLPNRWADKVIIGYSLCNRKYDKWDHIQTRYRRGFGLHIAFARACKWMEIEDDAERSMKYTTLSDEVPNSIRKPLKAFIERCSKYYQDKDLPYWAKDLCGWVSILEAVENTAGLKK